MPKAVGLQMRPRITGSSVAWLRKGTGNRRCQRGQEKAHVSNQETERSHKVERVSQHQPVQKYPDAEHVNQREPTQQKPSVETRARLAVAGRGDI